MNTNFTRTFVCSIGWIRTTGSRPSLSAIQRWPTGSTNRPEQLLGPCTARAQNGRSRIIRYERRHPWQLDNRKCQSEIASISAGQQDQCRLQILGGRTRSFQVSRFGSWTMRKVPTLIPNAGNTYTKSIENSNDAQKMSFGISIQLKWIASESETSNDIFW